MSETSISSIAGASCPPTVTPTSSEPLPTAAATGMAADVGSTVSTDNAAIKQKAAAVKDAVAGLAGETKRYASHRVADAKDTAAQWADTAKTKAVDYRDDMVDYVQRNPFQAVVIAAGIGFVAGLILKRR